MFRKRKERKKREQETRLRYEHLLKGDAVCIPFDISIALIPSSVNKDQYYILFNNRAVIANGNKLSEVLLQIGNHIKEVYT